MMDSALPRDFVKGDAMSSDTPLTNEIIRELRAEGFMYAAMNSMPVEDTKVFQMAESLAKELHESRSRFAAMTTQANEWHNELTSTRNVLHEREFGLKHLSAEISRLKARVNKLRAWLSLYSDHRPYCTDNGCECGFDELIGEAE